jgi:hypothetical protein
VAVPNADLKADPDTKIEATINATGATGTPTASQDYAVQNGTNPGVALTLDLIATDNILNAAESEAPQLSLTGKASGNFSAGDLVTLSVNGKTFTGTVDATGAYAINVPGADLLADPDSQVQASIAATSSLGNSTANALQDYAVDTAAPEAPKFVQLDELGAPTTPANAYALFDNVGSVTGQVLNNTTIDDATPTLKGEGANPGDTVSIFDTYLLNGQLITTEIGTATVAADGTWSFVPPSPLLSGDHTINIGMTDSAGNSSVLSDVSTFTLSAQAPTVAIARTASGTLSGNAAATGETLLITLSEPSTNFAQTDLDVVGGTLSNFTPVPSSGTAVSGYTQYTVTFVPMANSTGTATIGVLANKFTDTLGNNNVDTYAAGNNFEANNQVRLAYDSRTTPTAAQDTTAPSVIVSRAGTGDLASGNTDTITFILSEASSTFTQADISVTGGTLSGFAPVPGSGSAATGYHQYSAIFTPSAGAQGTATVGVASGQFSDAAGNLNTDTFVVGQAGYQANNLVSIGYNTGVADTTAPTIEVTRSGVGALTSSETVYFTLSEASTTFAASDITVTGGGTLSNFAPVPTSGTSGAGYTQYSATYTPPPTRRAPPKLV